MSNTNEAQKVDQLTYHLFTKLFLVVHQARSNSEPSTDSTMDTWVSELHFLQLMLIECCSSSTSKPLTSVLVL